MNIANLTTIEKNALISFKENAGILCKPVFDEPLKVLQSLEKRGLLQCKGNNRFYMSIQTALILNKVFD